MIKILILGAGGSVPTPSHCPSAYWVQVDQEQFLLDPGPGALVRLVKSEHAPDSVDAVDTVLLSHLHLDHCADLAPLLFALHSPVLESTKPFTIVGPPGLSLYINRLQGLYKHWLEPNKRQLNVLEILPGQALFHPLSAPGQWQIASVSELGNSVPIVSAFAANHPQDIFCDVCLCYRFQDSVEHRLVFSGDTEPSAGLTAASRNADLAVIECSTTDQQELVGHMNPSRVGTMCTTAGVRKIVLTHQYPEVAGLDLPKLVSKYYAGQIIAACDDSLFIVPDDSGTQEEYS